MPDLAEQVTMNLHHAPEPTEQTRITFARPHLIFFTELEDSQLRYLLLDNGVLAELAAQQYGLALATVTLNDTQAEVVRHLNRCGIPTVAWLRLSPAEGLWFNLQNYPQAVERYRSFHTWAQAHELHFDAVGLDIEPPRSIVAQRQQWGPRTILRHLWLAHENVLYSAAQIAYNDLIIEIHHDGYEVHTYQLPLLADDRRAGTTLVQRALDILDLPADVEVLMCLGNITLERMGHDLSGALIASYGPSADSIGVGYAGAANHTTDLDAMNLPTLSWASLQRDLLLAAHYTDVIYVFSLEVCVEHGILPHIAALNWEQEPQPCLRQRLLIGTLRLSLLFLLLLARFHRTLLAWMGWVLAAFLCIQHVRRRYTARSRQLDRTDAGGSYTEGQSNL